MEEKEEQEEGMNLSGMRESFNNNALVHEQIVTQGVTNIIGLKSWNKLTISSYLLNYFMENNRNNNGN